MRRLPYTPTRDATAAFESLEPRLLLDGEPIISEFMAVNRAGLQDFESDRPDWLEIHNPGSEAVDLTDWKLRDDNNEWLFPAMSLGPGEYRVIFASGKNRRDPAGELHTNFSLKGTGERLGLLDDLGTVVHEYDDYPPQVADISYGIAQDVEATPFVSAGDEARYLVPGDDPGDWRAVGFDDGAWKTGKTALGFSDTVPGFAVWNYKASVSVGHLSTALQVVESPGMQTGAWSENRGVINYWNSDNHGHYAAGEVDLPGFFGAMDDFAVEATGFVTIPSAGAWSFGVNSDDGFQLTIRDTVTTTVVDSDTPAGGDTISFGNPRGSGDTIGVFDVPEAGVYEVRLVYYERGGGAEVELFAAQGAHTAFNAAFDLVGDTASGGLAVFSEPVSGGTGGSSLSGLIRTDVEDDMKDVNASMFVRMPFSVADPSVLESLTLRMKYDDGYVAYLNGTPIASKNAPGAATWSSSATDERTDAQAGAWENVAVSAYLHLLHADDGAGPADNVLAIHAMNCADDDGDFLVQPELLEIRYLGLGEHFFAGATPGDVNSEEYWLRVEDTKFSHDRGFYSEPFSVTITTATPGAEIYYTTDGSEPSATHGTLYETPIPIHGTTVVRAAAFQEHYAPTNVDTQTYLFLDEVIHQPQSPEGFPGSWGGTTADYEMDPEVVDDPLYSDRMRDALLSLPTMSIVTSMDNLFGASGIYSNPGGEGVGWERPTSVEWINTDGTTGFQVDAGLRIYGGAFRGMGLTRKKSFRLLFKSDYGPTKLNYPLFDTPGAATSFDTIILRGGANDGWNNWGRENTQYVVDEFMRRTQLALGGASGHGTFCHLYLNGAYWGLYNPVERPEASFSATYFGGDKAEWDALNSAQPTGESNTATWNEMLNLVRGGLSDMASYQKLQGNNPDGTNDPAYDDLLDLDNYIQYMFSNFWGGTGDWPHHNWYAACRRPPNSSGFKFYNWDSEGGIVVWSNLNANRTGVNNSAAEPYAALRQNPEFRMLFADHVHRYLFNDGPATADASHARYKELADEVELAVIAESARWGDQASAVPYTLGHWEATRDYVLGTYMPQRSAIVLNQLRAIGLYPDVIAPSFHVNGAHQHGGTISPGDVLTIDAPAGSVYCTTDGSDPRPLGGGAPDPADAYAGALLLDAGTHVKSRVYLNGEWSALNEATFYVDLAPHIRITEIMYNPSEATDDEIAAGFTDKELFEFIEVRNISPTETVPLAGLRFGDGIDFTFPDLSVAPGEYVVVVKDEPAFRHRYDTFTGTMAGEYLGWLNNAGERIELDAPVGGIVHDFVYGDGWYGHTDGEGFSLTVRDPEAELELWALTEGWRASAAPGGTPGGADSLLAPGSILITEVLAHSDDPFVDTIELHNVTGSPIDVSGWFLSDRKTDLEGNEALTKYQIPPLPPIGVGEYLVLSEDQHFGAAFSLSELGDDVYLCSNAGGVAGGYREHVDFGASPRNVSIGVHTKTTGATDFALLDEPTFGFDNAYPYLEDLVINEVMYHPTAPTGDEAAAGFLNDDDFEFIELYNASTTTTYALRDFHLSSGVGFTFGWYRADDFGHEAWTLEPGATATWTAALPAGLDTYEVFARWDLLDAQGDARDLDGQARYRITHSGGATEVVRDQKPELDDEGPDYMDADGWVSLGTYDFNGSGQVVLTRGTNNAGNWTIADQVKFVSTADTVVVDDPVLDSWHTRNGPTSIGPGEYVVIVRNYEAFDARYDVADSGITVAGAYTGSLDNGGEKVKLQRAGNPEPTGFLPSYRIDYVNYGDSLPWPTEPDGGGFSLSRLSAAAYGNDAGNWASGSSGGTPGGANVYIDTTPPSVPHSVAAHVTIGPDTIQLTWEASHDDQTYVDHYVIFRDGDFHATSPTASYDDTDVLPAVTYSYRVSAVNRDGYESDLSPAAEVMVPGIVSYAVPDTTHVEITFSEALDPATAGVLANYVLTGGTFVDVAPASGGVKVILTTKTELVIDNAYTVTIHNLTTLSGNEMSDGQQITFHYEPRGSGEILWQYWTGIGGTSIAELTNHPNYPDSPSGEGYLTSLEGPVDWANDYGTRIQGYVHPPTSGDYTFWVSGDDNSNLYLSTDANPDNRVLIASVPGWTNPREWTRDAAQQSQPVFLAAGQKYYIEVLHKEGTGGDNIAVRWQLPDGSWENPNDPGEPIPGIRLSPYLGDSVPPMANILDVAPDPRMVPVDRIDIVFSEAVTGFDVGDLSLTRDGAENLLTGAASLTTANQVTWTLSGLTDLTAAAGTYVLTLRATGAGIEDVVGNVLAADASETWVNNLTGPTVDVVDVAPDPRGSPVGEVRIVFSEAVTGFDVDDLRLTRDGGANLLTGAEPLASADGVTWTLGGLGGLTAGSGAYALALTASGSGIRNAAHEPLLLDASDTWLTDATAPMADIIDVDPDPRTLAVETIQIVFSEPVFGLDIGDLTLTRDGGGNLLTGEETLETTDYVTWTLGGLSALTGTEGHTGGGFAVFNDHAPGPGTHTNTTAYSGWATPSGILKDITTGLETGVRLTVTASGIHYAGAQANPAAGTDAYDVFHGYVDLAGNGSPSIEIEAGNNDHYTYTFSGLDTGSAATYKFAGTAVRGNSGYTNRWTLVTLAGAEASAPAHSDGIGVVVISPTEAAVWTGHNSNPGQGFLAAWTDIDPGPDGRFAVVCQQYTGVTPGVGSGRADGSKGYGITGIRLEEVLATGISGDYELTLDAGSSGIADAVGNPLLAGASDGWTTDNKAPTAAIVDIAPDPRGDGVDRIDIVFDEPIAGLDLDDLVLAWNGGPDLLTGSETLETTDHVTWTLGGLAGLTAAAGNYTLTLAATGSGILDGAENPLTVDAADSWVMDPTVPPEVMACRRNDGADRPDELTSIAVTFSQDVSASLEADDLAIRDEATGTNVDLAGAAVEYDGRTNTARWDLSGAMIEPGYHTVTLHAEGVTNGSGVPLGGGSGVDHHTTFLVALVGDANLDGEVSRPDFLALREQFASVGACWGDGDLNHDGIVDYRDYMLLKTHYAGRVAAPTSAPLADDAPVEARSPAPAQPASQAERAAWYDVQPTRYDDTAATHSGGVAVLDVADVNAAEALPSTPSAPAEAVDLLAARPVGVEVPAADAAGAQATLVDVLAADGLAILPGDELRANVSGT